MKKEVDYLIVGQGLSGTFFSFHLIQERKSFLVIDKGFDHSSSFVAAGIINPMALKRLSKSWRAEEFINYNKSFYKNLDDFLNGNYHHTLPVHKLIASKEDEHFWQYRYKNFNLKDFLEETLEEPDDNEEFFSNKFKIGKVKETSWLNISQLLIDFRANLKKNSSLLEEDFEYSMLDANQYKGISFKNIVFCEGAKGANNPFFKHLPFALNKGQLLSIESDHIPTDSIQKKKVFILPYKDRTYKVGATFAWSWKDEEVEKEKTLILEEHIQEITKTDYLITEELCGIRPATRDRRPLLGKHHKYKNYSIFNGMGSKGCLIAPLLAKELYEHIEHNSDLNKEATINRFKLNLDD